MAPGWVGGEAASFEGAFFQRLDVIRGWVGDVGRTFFFAELRASVCTLKMGCGHPAMGLFHESAGMCRVHPRAR